jgi:cysteine desulfuration protein SufE
MVTSADSTTLADSAMSASDLILLQSNPLGLTTTLEDIVENFEFLDDWESRYGYIIDLGKLAPRVPQRHRTESNQVLGCQSQVWFISHHDIAANELLILVDSDAMIVRGLAAVVMTAFNRRSPCTVAAYDMEALFNRLDLVRHLSPTRGNGLKAMVKRIQASADALCRF